MIASLASLMSSLPAIGLQAVEKFSVVEVKAADGALIAQIVPLDNGVLLMNPNRQIQPLQYSKALEKLAAFIGLYKQAVDAPGEEGVYASYVDNLKSLLRPPKLKYQA